MITRLDRLGRTLKHLLELAEELQRRGVDLVVLDQAIDTSTPIGRMFFSILGSIAEFGRELIREPTIDGLVAAKARGREGGAKPKLSKLQAKQARRMVDEVDEHSSRRYTVAQVADTFGVSRPTIYRALERGGWKPGGEGEDERRAA